jgi:glycosyltransferase involved in cell wall biosynthesis
MQVDKITNTPFLSIVIPACNLSDYIEQTLISILKQEEFDDYEILVIDDNSSDSTKAVVSDLAIINSSIKLHDNTRSKGSRWC